MNCYLDSGKCVKCGMRAEEAAEWTRKNLKLNAVAGFESRLDGVLVTSSSFVSRKSYPHPFCTENRMAYMV